MVLGFNNIMDTLQLVFSIVNAPLFATFLLGMFWKRSTGHAAFIGLVSGTLAAVLHHGLTVPAATATGIHGGWLHVVHVYPSAMALNFYQAIIAFTVNFVLTVIISLMTKPRPESELVGLVYSLTPETRRAPHGLVRAAQRDRGRPAGDGDRAEHHLQIEISGRIKSGE